MSELLYQCRDPEQFLYHYTKAETLIKDILPTHKLKLSQYTRTNDPKESKDWHFNASLHDSTKYDLANYPLDELSSKMNAGLKQKTNVLCFTRDGPLSGIHIDDVYNRGFCRPRMWAQYAENHAGACLIFDRRKLAAVIRAAFPRPRPIAIGPVSYCNRGFLPNLGKREDITYFVIIDYLEQLGWDRYVREHLKRTFRRLFFEKNADWAQENEYRWVLFDGAGRDEFVDYQDSLRGVMFGASTSPDTINRVVGHLRGQVMFFQQLEWKSCAPWYRLERNFEWEATHAGL